MCFSGEMSAAFAALGLFMTWWVKTKTNNGQLAAGIFFFFLMEFLQALQYWFSLAASNTAAECATSVNQVLTVAGYLHICLQPYFCHLINRSLTRSCKDQHRYDVVLRLCLIGGLLLFLRWPLSYLPGWNRMDLDVQPTTEWLRGKTLCTYKSAAMMHLGWAVPMADPTYYVVGASIHSFLMFAPFVALYEKKGMLIQGAFLLLTGPVFADWMTSNLQEAASIWCLFSLAQIGTMLFLIREKLLINYGKGNVSVMATSGGKKAEEGAPCRYFVDCPYCPKTAAKVTADKPAAHAAAASDSKKGK